MRVCSCNVNSVSADQRLYTFNGFIQSYVIELDSKGLGYICLFFCYKRFWYVNFIDGSVCACLDIWAVIEQVKCGNFANTRGQFVDIMVR